MFALDHRFFSSLLGLSVTALPECGFDSLGLVDSPVPRTLTFIDSQRFLPELVHNPNVTGAFCSELLAPELASARPDVVSLVVDDPRFWFYTTQNAVAVARLAAMPPSQIHPTAVVAPNSDIAAKGVTIGARCRIEPRVVILSGVEIGDDSIVRAGSILGAEGFEHKRTSRGLLSVVHDGVVRIGARVEIGALNAISKGFAYRATTIGDDTRTDNLVHIAHGAQIGRRCLLPAACMIAGSSTVGDDVWIGPAAAVSSQVTVGAGAVVSIGAVVTRDVPAHSRVTGNFAVPHARFMARLKELTREDQ